MQAKSTVEICANCSGIGKIVPANSLCPECLGSGRILVNRIPFNDAMVAPLPADKTTVGPRKTIVTDDKTRKKK